MSLVASLLLRGHREQSVYQETRHFRHLSCSVVAPENQRDICGPGCPIINNYPTHKVVKVE